MVFQVILKKHRCLNFLAVVAPNTVILPTVVAPNVTILPTVVAPLREIIYRQKRKIGTLIPRERWIFSGTYGAAGPPTKR